MTVTVESDRMARSLNDDPLVPTGGRFTLGHPSNDYPRSDDAPSGPESRPFSLRFGQAPQRATARVPALRYDVARQVAVDEQGRPSFLNPQMRHRTTVGSKDGKDNPMEDWTYDFMPDEEP